MVCVMRYTMGSVLPTMCFGHMSTCHVIRQGQMARFIHCHVIYHVLYDGDSYHVSDSLYRHIM